MSNTKPKRVLLIGWDAADWQMIDPLLESGQMPNLKRFVEEGVRGNVATLTPPLSPMLWTSIATGKTADKHGVLGFAEPDGVSGKSRPVTSTGRTCKAIWNILSDAGRPAGAINWFASHPAEQINGFVVTDRFAHPTGPLKPNEPHLGWALIPGSVWPEDDLEPLSGVRVHPQMITQEQVLEFIPEATDAESANWQKVRELRALLAHCATVHNAATAFLDDRDWDFLGIYYDAIDRFAHAFMEFHPPRMGHIEEAEFERYKGVMNACYRYHDLLLGRLMNMIDEETAVILLSDHGFHSGKTRPRGTSAIEDGQPAAWHRPYGVIGFWGPGIAKGKQLYGASLLDVTPTILDILDMAPARDMDGLPLTQIWEEPRLCSERVDSYEAEGESQAEPHATSSAAVDEQIMQQLRALGYMGSDDAQAVTIDRARNLAAVYQSIGQSTKAMSEFQRILQLDPNAPGIRFAIAGCHLSMGDPDAAEIELNRVLRTDTPNARHSTLRSMIESNRGNYQAALASLEEATKLDDSLQGLHARQGWVLSKLDRLVEAEVAYEAAMQRDPDDADALDGIGLVYHRTGRYQEAVLAFTRSIALLRHRAQTHIHLGESLVKLTRFRWAVEAFSEAARISPADPTPHERLAELYKRVLKIGDKAGFHSRRAELIRSARREAQKMQSQTKPSSKIDFESVSESVKKHDAIPTAAHPLCTKPVTIVSGLPRSGTSLMMQMLHAGGMPILSDDTREPDESNPRGYFELESVKDTPVDDSWVQKAPGHAVKVIHALLRVLPHSYEYRVIFMKRNLAEVVASQSTMLDHLGRSGAELTQATLLEAYAREYDRIGAWIGNQSNFSVLEVSYNTLLASPQDVIASIDAFTSHPLDADAMLGAIDQSLYRQRESQSRGE